MPLDSTTCFTGAVSCGDMLRSAFRPAALPASDRGRRDCWRHCQSLAFGSRRKLRRRCCSPVSTRVFPSRTIKYMEAAAHGRQIQLSSSLPAHPIGVVAPAFKDLGDGVLGQSRGLDSRSISIPKVHRDEPSRLRRGQDRLWRRTRSPIRQIETETHKAALMEFRKQVVETPAQARGRARPDGARRQGGDRIDRVRERHADERRPVHDARPHRPSRGVTA